MTIIVLTILKVSGTQYALCLDGGLCSAYCQTKERKAAGVCAGPTNWDCYCEDGDGNREAGKRRHPFEREVFPPLGTQQNCIQFSMSSLTVGDVDMDNF